MQIHKQSGFTPLEVSSGRAKHSRGFTLIEVLLVILMMGFGLIVLTNMFLSHNKIYRSQSTKLNITGSVRFALDDIDNYVRQAYRTLASYGSFTASSQTLILQIQSVNSSERLIANTYDYVIYYLSGNNLMREIVADAGSARVSSTRLVAANVSNLVFSLNNGNYPLVTEVATNITCSESAGPQTLSFTADSKSKLRSY